MTLTRASSIALTTEHNQQERKKTGSMTHFRCASHSRNAVEGGSENGAGSRSLRGELLRCPSHILQTKRWMALSPKQIASTLYARTPRAPPPTIRIFWAPSIRSWKRFSHWIPSAFVPPYVSLLLDKWPTTPDSVMGAGTWSASFSAQRSMGAGRWLPSA